MMTILVRWNFACKSSYGFKARLSLFQMAKLKISSVTEIPKSSSVSLSNLDGHSPREVKFGSLLVELKN
jgi:hypothetical protein